MLELIGKPSEGLVENSAADLLAILESEHYNVGDDDIKLVLATAAAGKLASLLTLHYYIKNTLSRSTPGLGRAFLVACATKNVNNIMYAKHVLTLLDDGAVRMVETHAVLHDNGLAVALLAAAGRCRPGVIRQAASIGALHVVQAILDSKSMKEEDRGRFLTWLIISEVHCANSEGSNYLRVLRRVIVDGIPLNYVWKPRAADSHPYLAHTGQDALAVASAAGRSDLVELLLFLRPGDVVWRDSSYPGRGDARDNWLNPIAVAAANGHVDTVKLLCATVPQNSAVEQKVKLRLTKCALYAAVVAPQTPAIVRARIILTLLKTGADPQDALVHAAMRGDPYILGILMLTGADMSKSPVDGTVWGKSNPTLVWMSSAPAAEGSNGVLCYWNACLRHLPLGNWTPGVAAGPLQKDAATEKLRWRGLWQEVARFALAGGLSNPDVVEDAPWWNPLAIEMGLTFVLRPWTLPMHGHFHPGVRNAVVHTLLIAQRLDRVGVGKGGPKLPIEIPKLPIEIWLEVMGFFRRGWF